MCRCGPLPPGGLWTEVKRSRVSIHSTEKVEEGIGWVCMCAFWGEGEGRGGYESPHKASTRRIFITTLTVENIYALVSLITNCFVSNFQVSWREFKVKKQLQLRSFLWTSLTPVWNDLKKSKLNLGLRLTHLTPLPELIPVSAKWTN